MITESSAGNRQVLTKMLAGAVFGGASTALFLLVVGDDRLDFGNPASMVAVVAGLSYFLMGLLVGFGVLAPKTGARLLNVEDADEIREERPRLAPSAIACALIGVFLLALVLAPNLAGLGGRKVVLIISSTCVAGVVLITLRTGRRGDELLRQIGLEASASTLHAGLVILAVWAALAHLGYVSWVDPLGLVAGAALLHLVLIFAISTQKGLMRPR